MAGWMIQLDQRLSPLMAAMKALLYQGPVIHIDETRLPVLKEPGREASQQSFMWVYRGGAPERPVVWFQYADTRSGTVPRQFLFPGGVPPAGCDPPPQGLYLLTDGYSGYSALWPSRSVSAGTPPVGPTCGASSSRPPRGARTPPPPTRWWR
jgi:hypothetical protein